MNETATTLDRREKRKLETRARIENAAYLLFKKHGIDDTSIALICKEADVARRTFYSYFPNKHALLGGLGVSRLYSQSTPLLKALIERYPTTRERLQAMVDYIEQNYSSYEAIDRQLILAAPARFTNNPEEQREISTQAIQSFTMLIKAGQEAGDVHDTFSAEILASMIVGTLNTLTVLWAIDPSYPIFDKLEEAREMFGAVVCKD